MAKPLSRKTSSLLLLFESILNLAALPLSLLSITFSIYLHSGLLEEVAEEALMEQLEQLFDPRSAIVAALLPFWILAGIRVIRAFRLRAQNGQGFFRLSLAQAACFLACGILIVILGYTLKSTVIVSVLAGIALISGRVFAIFRKRRPVSIIVNILMILAIGYLSSSFFMFSAMLFLMSVFALMAIIFSRISFSVLKNIIAKTHAMEIIFGLILLIVTFSLLLVFFEPGMSDFKDALWYCFAIVTTIGFGDLTAVTDFGRVLSVILGAYGIIVVALITSIIVNFYGEVKKTPETDSGDETETAGSTEA